MTFRLHYFERVSSTMDVIHQLASEGAAEGTAVIAGEQLEGRGSRGRSWHSPPGGLWLSMLFRPPAAGAVEVMSLRVGLTVAESLDPFVSHPLRLKWPNDLMLGRRKVGGVLCEARWQGEALGWVAVGIGMNVRNRIPDELSPIAVSLDTERPDVTVEEVADAVAGALRRLDLGFGALSPSELERFGHRDWLRGQRIDHPVTGTVAGLRKDGALLVRTAKGFEIPLRSGSVELAAVSQSR